MAHGLQELRREHDHVRIVAHSLGCYHLLQSIALLDRASLPDEIHLCGAALVEHEVQPILQRGIAQHMVCNYWSDRDYLLYYLFRVMAWGQTPLGAAPTEHMYDKFVSVQVCDFFDFFVHNKYGSSFYKFAQSLRQLQGHMPAQVQVKM